MSAETNTEITPVTIIYFYHKNNNEVILVAAESN